MELLEYHHQMFLLLLTFRLYEAKNNIVDKSSLMVCCTSVPIAIGRHNDDAMETNAGIKIHHRRSDFLNGMKVSKHLTFEDVVVGSCRK